MGQGIRNSPDRCRKPKMLILGALMRKLVEIAYAILKSNKPFDPTLHSA